MPGPRTIDWFDLNNQGLPYSFTLGALGRGDGWEASSHVGDLARVLSQGGGFEELAYKRDVVGGGEDGGCYYGKNEPPA